MSWLTRSIGQRTIEHVMREQTDGVSFDAIDVTGGSPAARVSSEKARRLNREQYHLAEVGGSDAHFLQAVGACYTTFDGSSADDLRRAILAGRTGAGTGAYPTWRELGVRQVARQQWRGIMATPRKMGWGPTVLSFLKIPGTWLSRRARP
jgi:predicted metal-dependent phosphoesterase TrpH